MLYFKADLYVYLFTMQAYILYDQKWLFEWQKSFFSLFLLEEGYMEKPPYLQELITYLQIMYIN